MSQMASQDVVGRHYPKGMIHGDVCCDEEFIKETAPDNSNYIRDELKPIANDLDWPDDAEDANDADISACESDDETTPTCYISRSVSKSVRKYYTVAKRGKLSTREWIFLANDVDTHTAQYRFPDVRYIAEWLELV
jgi:hypothetical protein